MELNFRTLEAHEIDCKATVVDNKVEIVLHSKAATCTKLLNESVGVMNWEKEYTSGNKNCIVRIWDKDKNMWVSKEDCGGPLTDIDGHKGQASNGFKRVCALGWGLGIELYSQPEIRIPMNDDNTIYDSKGLTVKEKYTVKEIEYDDERVIKRCVIVDSEGHVVYDGPNEKGLSNIVPEQKKEEKLVIPDDADMVNNDVPEDVDEEEMEEKIKASEEEKELNPTETVVETTEVVTEKNEVAKSVTSQEENEDNIPEDLPDNTDGYVDILEEQLPPFSIDYKAEFEREIERTRTKKSDVLKVLNIDSFEEVGTVSTELLDNTLAKLKARKTYVKK